MNARLFHVTDGARSWFVVTDGELIVRGAVWESEGQVLRRWRSVFHNRGREVERVKGMCSPALVVTFCEQAQLGKGGVL